MRAIAVFHSRFWRDLDWKNILLLFVALCIIGFDLVGRVKVHQHSLGRRMQHTEATLGQEGQVTRPPLQRLHDPEASVSWKTVRVEGAASKEAETPLESSPPSGYTVTRVSPQP